MTMNSKINCFLTGLTFLFFISCNNNTRSSVTSKEVELAPVVKLSGWTMRTDTDSLIIYTPKYKNIDLVCGTMPSENDSSVILCAEAAYTGELLTEFRHSNILGDHVSSGKRYKGVHGKRITGAFVYYNGKYKFLYQSCSNELDSAARYGGMGFGQEMLIHKGKMVPCRRKDTNRNEFRALCEQNHHLCVIDSRGMVNFIDFKNALLHQGVTEALYLDMGAGWNNSWWRDDEGRLHVIHPKTHSYTTNWITFYNR